MATSAAAIRGAPSAAVMRGAPSAAAIRGAPSAALQGKPVAKVRSFGPAKLSKKEPEKTLEKNRVQRESLRAQIEKNKKEKAAEKKKAEAKEMKKAGKDLKKCSKLALKKPSKLGKVEAAPKEAIAPRVGVAAASLLTGTDGTYQSRPSRLPVSHIYERAEIEKREEARRVRQLGKIEAAPKEEIVPTVEVSAVPVTAESALTSTGLAEIEKQEEEERAQREWVRAEIEWIQAEIEKTRKEEEEEEKKRQEEEERAQREWVRTEIEWIRAEIEKQRKEERKKQEEEERAQREWVRAEIEWIRAEIEKNKKEEEERKKQEEKKREVGQAIKSLRKQIGDYAIVEPASPTRVLSDWSSSGSCSPCSSTATFESDDRYDHRF